MFQMAYLFFNFCFIEFKVGDVCVFFNLYETVWLMLAQIVNGSIADRIKEKPFQVIVDSQI